MGTASYRRYKLLPVTSPSIYAGISTYALFLPQNHGNRPRCLAHVNSRWLREMAQPIMSIGTSNTSVESFSRWLDQWWSCDGHWTAISRLAFVSILLGDSPYKNGQQDTHHRLFQRQEESNQTGNPTQTGH